ncbi:cytosine permease, partial [Salmonella enterica subsp. enterica serovar Anatum]|nr:cytosine permease [Salmonella enterica subsp. enterica serovar Anatum]
VKHPPPHKEAAQENKSPFSSFQFVSSPPPLQSFNLKYFSFILHAALAPTKLNYKNGVMIASIISLLICPWKLMENQDSIYLFLDI